jgi:deoxyribonuclease V
MIAIIDVGYHPDHTTVAAGIVHTWTDAELSHTYTLHRAPATAAQEYVPGQFWRRELPFVLEIIKEIKENITTIVVDGYVTLPQGKWGLGGHLYQALAERVNVIGVAKTPFHGDTTSVRVVRGQSKKPLFVTAAGLSPEVAGRYIQDMHGEHRLPTAIKLVDRLSRQ